MTRKIIPHTFHIEEVELKDTLEAWICQQATILSWILAHALDGVIWGWANKDELHLSHDVAPKISPPLLDETLQQLRLFNPDYEVKLWRVGDEWKAIRITDVEDTDAAAIDEKQLLWGTHATPLENGFIGLEDGSQGLHHIVPPFEGSEQLAGKLGLRSDQNLKRVYLSMRHYLTEDHLGVNSITLSRLTGLGVISYEQK